MNNKKGFTLIELLAIIVILAIIAVITVPLILGIINDAKLNSITDSAYGYKSAIQNYSMYLQTVDSTNPGIKGSYTVEELKTLGLEVKGQEPDEGIILIDNEGISGCLKYEEYASYLYNNKVINTAKGNCPTQKLVTTGDGLYKSTTEPGRLIYRGANPNNRIFLKEDGTNNTLYRIVSYETDGTIKVVRDEKIGNKAWDERDSNDTTTGPRHNTNNTYCNYSGTYYGCNVWSNQTNTLFNGASLGNNFHYSYYNSATATTLTNGGAGTVNDESTLNQYLNGTWLTSALSSYIDNHKFNVGGIYNIDKEIQKEKEEESLYTWTGKVGLLNITEYAEASLNESCTSVKSNMGPGSGSPCKEMNWTYKKYDQWSLTPHSSSHGNVYPFSSVGYFSNAYACGGLGVRPAFYLKSDVSLSGSGTEGTEYTIN